MSDESILIVDPKTFELKRVRRSDYVLHEAIDNKFKEAKWVGN